MRTVYFDPSLLTSTFCPRAMFYRQVENTQTKFDSIAAIYGNAGHRFLRKLYEGEGFNPALAYASEYYQENTEGKILDAKEFRTCQHLQLVCLNYYQNHLSKYLHQMPIKIGEGDKKILGTELNFALPYKVTDDLQVILCGTIDKVVKKADRQLEIIDYKFTATWDSRMYLQKAAHIPQLRFYSMMLKKFLGLSYYPSSRLEGIFLSRLQKKDPKLEKICYVEQSDSSIYLEEDMKIFEEMLHRTMAKWIGYLDHQDVGNRQSWPMDWMQCSGYWGDCSYMDLCNADRDQGLYELLKTKFEEGPYEPLKFQN